VVGDEPGEVRRAAAIIPVKFDYAAPETLEEAVGILAGNADASVIAGGQSLIPALTVRRTAPSVVVDISQIASLHGISSADDPAGLRIGATTTLAEIAADPAIRTGHTALAEAAESVGDPQVRHRATIGGSLGAGHPAGDVIAAAIALRAVIVLAGPDGTRRVAAEAFVTGPYATAIRAGEIITSVEIPAAAPGSGSAYVKQRHPGSGYAICGVAAAVTVGAGGIEAVRLAVSGAAEHPRRLEGAEDAASGKSIADAAAAASEAVAHAHLKGVSDVAATAAYRKHLAGVLAGRAIDLAGQRAGGA
jgi:carbon-monoxide dehydrogenase medium subunit